ncbi:chromosomal replication initiator protein DnaA [Helicobacter sp. MIT 14-3879]|uniref:chromosomal replication initiator protein DnaA n=1 Tax=Helicobacter sp. MIT 14-3879 TaxID=2040649 RepID=UPI000E1E40D0|nr:chromosomal replication initiator protein DnaA [Helicobacter sp. MIT 14-3879]RDU65025.1 chromosomal replication initiator protein DnaA [Helicobacter sp. MIT 14-3879]
MIWNDILQDLKKDLSQNEYEKYIKNIRFNEKNSDSNLKVLEVNNIFLLNWIKRNYINKIASLFEIHTEIKPEIKIILKEQNEKSSKDTKYNFKIIPNVYKSSILNPSFTFESFVIGESNKFSFNLSKEVAKNQAKSYNPLFISGDTGLGKTHLLNAIGNYNINNKNVILITSEEFLNDYITHLNNKSMDRFRNKYRNCDYLLIDDIQFFSGKHTIQEEFFHTFNILKDNNKQIVLTSDKPIKDLIGIEERLKSRFESGIISKINPPELETKIEIIKKKCELDLIQLNDEIIEFIALNINNNIRTIEGILTTINSFSSIMNQEITIDLVKNTIKNFKKNNNEKINLEDIIDSVSKVMNIKQSEIKSKKRTKNILFARKIVIFLGRKLTTNSMPELAKILSMKDHSTISKAMKKIQEEVEINNELKIKIEEVEIKIKDLKNNN